MSNQQRAALEARGKARLAYDQIMGQQTYCSDTVEHLRHAQNSIQAALRAQLEIRAKGQPHLKLVRS